MSANQENTDGKCGLIYPQSLLTDLSLFENIIASMSEGVMFINRLGEIVLVNKAMCGILGMPADRVRRSGWAELFYGDPGNDEFNQLIIDVIDQKLEHCHRQVKYTEPSGRQKELVVTSAYMASTDDEDRKSGGVLFVLHDITEFVELQKREKELLLKSQQYLKDKIESLDILARAVAHQIRNPIVVIGGLAKRLMSLRKTSDQEKESLNFILSGAVRLEKIVKQVRRYADLPPLDLISVSLPEWASRRLNDYKVKADRKGVNLLINAESAKEEELMAAIDEKQFFMAVASILDNAFEAMPDGGDLVIGFSADSDTVKLIITDSGSGVESSDLPHLFDPFFSTKADAVGMNLAIAKRIISEHHGEITVSSHPGQGASFALSIPRIQGI